MEVALSRSSRTNLRRDLSDCLGQKITNKEFDEVTSVLTQTRDGRRIMAGQSPVWFSRYYLRRLLWDCQKRWQTHLLKAQNSMIIAPADHGKTVCTSHDLPTREICLNRNIRILNISASARLAIKNLSVVEQDLRLNSRIIEDFGMFHDRSNTWGRTGFTVIRDQNLKDFTYEAIGILGELTGGRYDLIIFDDVITDKNARNQDQRDKIREFIFGTVLPRLEPTGRVWVIGTRKHYADLYAELLEKLTWNCLVEDAIIEDPGPYEIRKLEEPKINDLGFEEYHEVVFEDPKKKGNVLCPEQWTIEDLLLKQYNIGSVLFKREYRGVIDSDDDAWFPLPWLEQCRDRNLSYCDTFEEVDERGYIATFGGADPAFSMEKKAIEDQERSFAAYLSFGIREFEPLDVDLIGLFRKKGMTPTEVVKKLVELNSTFEYKHLFFERNSAGIYQIREVKKNSNVPIVKHYTGTNKTDFYIGVPSMSVIFENAQIRLPYKTSRDKYLTNLLITELHRLGIEKHDDLVMALWIGTAGIFRFWEAQRRARKHQGGGFRHPRHQRVAAKVSPIMARAQEALENGGQVRCNKPQYIRGIRLFLQNKASEYVERGKNEFAKKAIDEIKRLDKRFKVK